MDSIGASEKGAHTCRRSVEMPTFKISKPIIDQMCVDQLKEHEIEMPEKFQLNFIGTELVPIAVQIFKFNIHFDKNHTCLFPLLPIKSIK